MSDEQERLKPSDLNRCLVNARYEGNNANRMYYPEPIFEGFSSPLGSKEDVLTKNKRALQEAMINFAVARQWQKIIHAFNTKTPYSSEQIDLINQKIQVSGAQKEFYELLLEQNHEEVEEVDLEVLNDDIKRAILELDKFTTRYDPVNTVANSSYKLVGNRLIIVHGTVDTTVGQNPAVTAKEIIDLLTKQGIVIDGQIEVTHLIPEVGKGKLDGVFGVNHIRLRVAQGNPIDMKNSQLIDPRDIYQDTFDVVNCGRYVATMIGQAVGLLMENLNVSIDALKASPIVQNADKFTTAKALQEATKFASEHPTDVESQNNEVGRILAQIQQLNHSYKQRSDLGKEYNYFWGSFFGGHSASTKRDASQEILDNYKNNKSLDLTGEKQDAAEKGELGKLYSQLREALNKVREGAKKEDNDETPDNGSPKL